MFGQRYTDIEFETTPGNVGFDIFPCLTRTEVNRANANHLRFRLD